MRGRLGGALAAFAALLAAGALGSAGCSGGWAVRGSVHARLAIEGRALVVPTVGTEGVGPHVRESPPLEGVEVRCPACTGEGRRVFTDYNGFFRLDVGRERPTEPFRLIFFKRGYRPVEVLILPTIRERKTTPLLVMLTPDESAPEEPEPSEPYAPASSDPASTGPASTDPASGVAGASQQ